MIRIALVGCGYWGKNYIDAISKIPNAKLVWICTRRTVIAQDKLPTNCRFTTKYKEILADQKVDGIIIATPVQTHYRLAKLALEHGKDILVEKPMTNDAGQALELDVLAKKLKRILMIGHIFMFHPAILKLKEIVDKNELGSIRYIYSRRSGMGPISLNTDAMWNLAPHDISISNLLTGQSPTGIWAKDVGERRKRKSKDTFLLGLNYKKTTALIYVSWSEPLKVRETMVVGDKKTAIFNDSLGQKLTIYHNRDPKQTYSPPVDKSSSPLERQCRHFIDCIKTREQPITNGQAGYLNVKILKRANESLKKNKELTI